GNNLGNNAGNNQGLGGLGGGFGGPPGGGAGMPGNFGGGFQGAAGLKIPAPGQPMPGGIAGKPADARRLMEEMPRLEAEQAQMGFKRPANAGRDIRLRQQLAASSIALPPLVVREYAYMRSHGAEADRRTDATETVYWNPVLVLNDGKG